MHIKEKIRHLRKYLILIFTHERPNSTSRSIAVRSAILSMIKASYSIELIINKILAQNILEGI